MIRLLAFLGNSGGGGEEPFAGTAAEAEATLAARFPDCVECVRSRPLDVQPGGGAAPFAGVLELGFAYAKAALAAAESDLSPLLAPGAAVEAVVTGHERVVMRQPGWRAPGEMKGTFPFRRRSDLDMADFHRYWWSTHGPIAALTEQSTCYVQTFLLDALWDDTSRAYDAVTELYWPSVEAANAAMASRQMTEDQSTDAGNFVDRDSVSLVYLQEEIVRAWHG